jgi:hypothetical protein
MTRQYHFYLIAKDGAQGGYRKPDAVSPKSREVQIQV